MPGSTGWPGSQPSWRIARRAPGWKTSFQFKVEPIGNVRLGSAPGTLSTLPPRLEELNEFPDRTWGCLGQKHDNALTGKPRHITRGYGLPAQQTVGRPAYVTGVARTGIPRVGTGTITAADAGLAPPIRRAQCMSQSTAVRRWLGEQPAGAERQSRRAWVRPQLFVFPDGCGIGLDNEGHFDSRR